MKTFIVDGNYYLHRSWSISVRTKKIEHLRKNTLTLFLTSVCNDALAVRATHILVVFDAKRSWRHDIFKDYKANRNKGALEVTTSTGETLLVSHSHTAGAFVKDAKNVCELAGLPVARKKGYEGDDLIGCACHTIPGRKVFSSRDKDLSVLVDEETTQYWPMEKVFLTPKGVFKKFGVHPHQIPEYLALMGDKTDNIPGVPGVATKTAAKWLAAHGDIRGMLKDKKILEKLKPHKAQLLLARKLTTLKCDVTFKLEDLVPQPLDMELSNHVWAIPKSLKELSDARHYANKRGLFGK